MRDAYAREPPPGGDRLVLIHEEIFGPSVSYSVPLSLSSSHFLFSLLFYEPLPHSTLSFERAGHSLSAGLAAFLLGWCFKLPLASFPLLCFPFLLTCSNYSGRTISVSPFEFLLLFRLPVCPFVLFPASIILPLFQLFPGGHRYRELYRLGSVSLSPSKRTEQKWRSYVRAPPKYSAVFKGDLLIFTKEQD